MIVGKLLESAFSTRVFTSGVVRVNPLLLEKAGSENLPEPRRGEHAAGLLTGGGRFSLTKPFM